MIEWEIDGTSGPRTFGAGGLCIFFRYRKVHFNDLQDWNECCHASGQSVQDVRGLGPHWYSG